MLAFYIFLGSTVFFLLVLIKTTLLRVPDIHIGILSNLFTGRLLRQPDNNNFSIPICKPKKEGLCFKKPWESVTLVSTGTQTKIIKNREFPVKGGSIFASGAIQYRISAFTAYRYLEVEAEAIDEGLDSELDQILRHSLVTMDVEQAVTESAAISTALDIRLRTVDLRTTEEIHAVNGCINDTNAKTRVLFGKQISYAEHSYGIEILKAKIDTLDPDPKLKEARNKIQNELYQTQSQTQEFNHLLARMRDLKNELPELSDEKKAEFIQVWQKMSSKDIKKIEVEGADGLIGALSAFLTGLGKGGSN